MRFAVVALSLCLVLAHSADTLGESLQHLDGISLLALGRVSKHLENKFNLPPLMQQLRRMSSHGSSSSTSSSSNSTSSNATKTTSSGGETEGLSADCKAACPDTEAAIKEVEKKMMTTAMEKHADTLTEMSSQGEQTPAEMQAMMDKLMPMMGDMLNSAMEQVCAKSEPFTCMQTNALKCLSDNQDSNGMGAGMLNGQLHAIPCVCTACPETRKAYVDAQIAMMSVMMQVLMALGNEMSGNSTSSSTDKKTMEDKIMKGILTGFCPLIGAKPCFDKNPNECGNVFTGNKDQQGMMQMLKIDMTDISKLEPNCTEAGISTSLPGAAGKKGSTSGSSRSGVLQVTLAMLAQAVMFLASK